MFTDWGVGRATMFLQTEEDVDVRLKWIGCWGLQSEMRDDLTPDRTIMVVQSEDNLGGMLKMLDRGVGRDEMVSNEEHEFQEGTELDCSEVAFALGVFEVPEAELESQLDQVGNVPGLWVEGGGSRGHDELDGAHGGWIFPS